MFTTVLQQYHPFSVRYENQERQFPNCYRGRVYSFNEHRKKYISKSRGREQFFLMKTWLLKKKNLYVIIIVRKGRKNQETFMLDSRESWINYKKKHTQILKWLIWIQNTTMNKDFFSRTLWIAYFFKTPG